MTVHRWTTLASAAALALALTTGGTAAQDLGVKQLQDSAASGFAQLGLDGSMIDSLSLDELAQIEAVTTSADTDAVKTDRIETILRGADARIAAGGATEPVGAVGDISTEDLAADMVVKANVGAYVAQLGLGDQVDVDMLTTDELLQVQLVQESGVGIDEQRVKVEQLFAD